jgi:DNA-binding response OmpR family regulator
MPGENGYLLLEKLRKMEQEQGRARVPAIALTAYAREEDRNYALEAGFETHMPKPIEPDKLVALVLKVASKRLGRASWAELAKLTSEPGLYCTRHNAQSEEAEPALPALPTLASQPISS